MLESRRNPRTVSRRLALLAGVLASAALATSAQAIPYFTTDCGQGGDNCGFDNASVMEDVDFMIPLDATFGAVASGNTTNSVGLLSSDIINDTATSIDRSITWTIINNSPSTQTEFLLILTALSPTPTDYSNANIDVDIDGSDPMVVASLGSLFFAGYHLTLDDFTLVAGNLTATRRFRYTVDVPEGAGGPPALGIAFTTDFSAVPEPATGLLLAGAVLVATGAGRKRRA